MTLKEQIINFSPSDEQEQGDKEYFLKFIEKFEDTLTRNNIFGHFSSSAFIINGTQDKTVLVYHNIFDGWVYPGGHADGEENLLNVAIREVEEETGLKAKVLDNKIYAIQANPVPSHTKNGEFISAHTHFDVIYLLEANDTIPLIYREDESKGVKWVSLEEMEKENLVPFVKPIHRRLIKKLKKI